MLSMDIALAGFRDRILAAASARSPLRLRGAGTKDFYGEALTGEVLDTRAYSGIVDYEPSELVLTARCGTALSEIEKVLATQGQFLPWEPPAFGADPTIGGVVASGLSGPRRASAGAARDFVLGAALLAANGELLHFGGRVMKNVAGFDVSRLLCGSLGILGLIAEVSLKVLPLPRAETTLRIECDARAAIDCFNRWRALPLPISATSWRAGILSARLSGVESALRAARVAIGGDEVDEAGARAAWRSLRDQTSAFFQEHERGRIWRLSVPATAPLDFNGLAPRGASSAADDLLIEWAGALRWLRSDAPADGVRALAAKLGGSATLWRGARDTTMFHPLAPVNLELHRRLKREFDPPAIFNRNRLVDGL
jgi:glycolate oxidase FAD binding subunit